MADKKDFNLNGDSGLGNLPPLSDFDSTAEETSDSGLPPLGNFDSAHGSSGLGGLPPIDDIKEETPQPAGGNIKPVPAGFGSSGIGASSGALPAGMGFQDLAADSDFSPETPDIGPGPSPGPSSGMDTPMFDSAFGGPGDFGGFSSPAATQAMETPMFGGATPPAGGGGAFDADAFDTGAFNRPAPPVPPAGGFDQGTPMFEVAPDTQMQSPLAPAAAPKPAKGGSPMLAIVLLIVGVIGGIAGAPYLNLSFLPNPTRDELTKAQAEIKKLNAKIEELAPLAKTGGEKTPISKEELDKLRSDIAAAQKEMDSSRANLESTNAQLAEATTKLEDLHKNVEVKNEEYETVQTAYQELSDEKFLMDARLRGLDAEVERLTKFVGQLEDANSRRILAKDALATNLDRLIIQIKESMPLTPERFAHEARVKAAEDLRKKLDGENWATPELMNEYTDVYLKELQAASAQEYFFANVPLTDQLGNQANKWAECVMEGNYAVYYRSLDGINIGVYRNSGTIDNPSWKFFEETEPLRQQALSQKIAALRVKGYEEKVQLLTGQTKETKRDSLSRIFKSL